MNYSEQAKSLAERLTEFLLCDEKAQNNSPSDLTIILSKLDDFAARLGIVENQLAASSNNSASANSALLAHPSLQRFEIEKTAAYLPHTNIKACTFEPNGKPCDECAMCSTRGF